MTTALFTDGEASDPGYRNIRDAKDRPLKSARWHCEYLWILFQYHADNDFRVQLRSNFDARYWEMYLTMSFIFAGYAVTSPKPEGPDVGIIHRGQRIWFEATSPTCGVPGKPDSIGEAVEGEVPEEKIILRYLNSISTKYEQYLNWLKKGIVSDKDAFVIAINPWAIPFDHTDADPPRILQAGYTVGAPYVEVDPKVMKPVGSGYYFRDFIEKAPKPAGAGEKAKEGAKVPTGVFQLKEYAGLSALLCSRVEVINHRGEMGEDFQLAPTPHAAMPLPESFRLRGVYYDVKGVESGYQVTPN
jgi:hypothetical protein